MKSKIAVVFAALSLAACGGGGGGSPAPPPAPPLSLTIAPDSALIASDQGVSTIQTVTLNFANGTPNSVTTAVEYTSGSGWLTVTPTNSSMTLTANSPLPGTFDAAVVVNYSGGGTTGVQRLPVKLTAAPLPNVTHIAPYVGVAGEAATFTVRGIGFNRINHPVRIGNVDAGSVTTISDTELRVAVPALATPGSYAVSIGNDPGVATTTSRLLVLAPQTFAAAEVDVSSIAPDTGENRAILLEYDDERQTLYIGGLSDHVHRARLVNGTWTVTPLPNTQVAPEARLTVDGTRLLIQHNETTFDAYDPDRDVVTNTYPTELNRIVGLIYPLNDGNVALDGGARSARVLDYLRGSHVGFSFANVSSHVSSASYDKGRLTYWTDGGGGFYLLDNTAPSFQVFTEPPPVDVYSAGGLDRHGDRIVFNGALITTEFATLGTFPHWVRGGLFTPDNKRLYTLDAPRVPGIPPAATFLNSYDVSNYSGPYPYLGSVELPRPTGFRPSFAVSADGRTIFICGHDRLFVMPAP